MREREECAQSFNKSPSQWLWNVGWHIFMEVKRQHPLTSGIIIMVELKAGGRLQYSIIFWLQPWQNAVPGPQIVQKSIIHGMGLVWTVEL